MLGEPGWLIVSSLLWLGCKLDNQEIMGQFWERAKDFSCPKCQTSSGAYQASCM